MRRKALVLLLCTLPMLLAGCWDRRELEEHAFVLALGIDEGKIARFSITAAIALPAKMAGGGKGGGGGGGDEKPFMLTTVEASTIPTALSMISSYVDRRVSLLHTKALFMGEKLARTDALAPMDALVRFRETRRTIFLIVTKGDAKRFMTDMDPKMEKDPQRFIEQMTYSYRYTGLLPSSSQLQHFVTNVNTGYAEPLTYYAALHQGGEKKNDAAPADRGEREYRAGDLPREGGPNIEMFGGAAFNRQRMVGVLTGDQTRAALMLRDEYRAGTFSIGDPQDKTGNSFLSLEVRRSRPTTVTVDVSGDRPRIRATVSLEAELLAVQSRNDYTEPNRQQVLEGALAQDIANQAESLVRQAQAWRSDIFGFGQHVVKRFATVAEWERYDWQTRFATAEIHVDVQVTVRRFGVQLSPPTAG